MNITVIIQLCQGKDSYPFYGTFNIIYTDLHSLYKFKMKESIWRNETLATYLLLHGVIIREDVFKTKVKDEGKEADKLKSQHFILCVFLFVLCI